MIEIVLLVLLVLVVRTKFTIGGVFVATKCGNCDYIEERRGFDEFHLDSEDYHYCSVAEREVLPSDTSCRYYK